MNFKKWATPFLLISFFLLSHCGLKIGEKAPLVPEHRVSLQSGYCSQLIFQEELIFYFSNQISEYQEDDDSKRKRASKALRCVRAVIKEIKDRFKPEFLERQGLLNLFNLDFFEIENIKPIKDHITKPDHFDNYLSIKDHVLYLIKQWKVGGFAHRDQVCRPRAGKGAISKSEANELEFFLEDILEFLLQLEVSAEEIFDDFFKKNKLVSKIQLNNFDKKKFISFLYEYLSDDFPEYVKFLKSKDSDKILQPSLDILQLSVSDSKDLTSEDVQHILLHIYMIRTVFSLYDADKNAVLDADELEALSCLINPVVSIVLSSILEDESEFVKSISSVEKVAGYILRYQEIPDKRDISYLFFSMCLSIKLEPLSYGDISRLVSILFTYFDSRKDDFVFKENFLSIINRVMEPEDLEFDLRDKFSIGGDGDIMDFVGARSGRVLQCVASVMEQTGEELIPGEISINEKEALQFLKEDLPSVLDGDFFKMKFSKSTRDSILNISKGIRNNPNNYFLILNHLLDVALKEGEAKGDVVCNQKGDGVVISKAKLEILLRNVSEFLFELDGSSEKKGPDEIKEYIIKAVFFLYDANKDFSLDSKELEVLSCFVSPIVSMFLPLNLKGRTEFVKGVYSLDTVVDYILRYQEIPDETDFHSVFSSICLSKNLDSLSYEDVSRLISALLDYFSIGNDGGTDSKGENIVFKENFLSIISHIMEPEAASFDLRDELSIEGDGDIMDFVGARSGRVLQCVASVVEKTRDTIPEKISIIDQDVLNFINQDLPGILNNNFFKTKTSKSKGEGILSVGHDVYNPSHFILIVNNILDVIAGRRAVDNSEGNVLCNKDEDKAVISRNEFEILLRDMSKFLVKLEVSAEEIFDDLKDGSWIFKSRRANEAGRFRDELILILSDHLSDDFPEYSNIESDEVLDSLLDILQLSSLSSSSGVLTVNNVKYMLLNIYITKFVFSLYNFKRDSVLDVKELEALSCLITPVVSFILPSVLSSLLKDKLELRDKIELVKDIYSVEDVVYYMLRYQEIPGDKDLSYLTSSICLSKDLKPLSYGDVSRLVSVLFLPLFSGDKEEGIKGTFVFKENFLSIINRVMEPEDLEFDLRDKFSIGGDGDIMDFVGARSGRVLQCVASVMEKAKDIIPDEIFVVDQDKALNFMDQYLSTEGIDKDEALNFIDQYLSDIIDSKLFESEMLKSIRDGIREDPSDLILFINNVLDVVFRRETAVDAEENILCNKDKDKTVISKNELELFLRNISEFLLQLEGSSKKVFNDLDDNWIFKSQRDNEAERFKTELVAILSNYLSDDFPEYIKFLEDVKDNETLQTPLPSESLSEKVFEYLPDNLSEIAKEFFRRQNNDDPLQPLLSMLELSSSDTLNVNDVKYMLLNIYMMKTLFFLYDVDKNTILDSKELKALSCLITPVISAILSSKPIHIRLISELFSKEYISTYIINNQNIPEGPEVFLLFYHSLISGDFTSSYGDISRLISIIFMPFFEEPNPVHRNGIGVNN